MVREKERMQVREKSARGQCPFWSLKGDESKENWTEPSVKQNQSNSVWLIFQILR